MRQLRPACASRAGEVEPAEGGGAAGARAVRLELEALVSEIRSLSGEEGPGEAASRAPEEVTGPDLDRQVAPPPGAPQRGTTKVVVVSAGHDSGDIADFFLDDELVPIIGPEGRRGLNVVILDPGTTRIVSARSYDVWGDPEAQSGALARDLGALPRGHVVLAALKDSGMEHLGEGALEALASVGASLKDPLGFRESYALIGVKGGSALAERRSSKMLLVDTLLPFALDSLAGRRQGVEEHDDTERTWEEALHILEEVGRARPR